MAKVRLASLAVVAAFLIAASALRPEAPRSESRPRDALIGVFPNHFKVIDEATGMVIGKVPFESGIPRRTALSRARTRFYTVEAGMEKIEIVDIAGRKTIDKFTLSEGNRKVRIKTLEPDPLHRFVMLVVRPVRKEVDRFVIEPSALIQYDLATHTIIHTVPWPNGEERENANLQFSPDGKYMYLFSEQDVLIFETTNFTQVDKWDLSKPVEEGFGAFEFGQSDVTTTSQASPPLDVALASLIPFSTAVRWESDV
jgi:hypothetical protein